MVGIYKITNPKGKMYIGQSINIQKRFKYYKRLNCKNQRKIYNSLKKYGPKNHHFEVIEECGFRDLNKREIYWIEFFKSIKEGLNLASGGEGGGQPSLGSRKLMSKSHKGKKVPKEVREKISKSKTNHPMYSNEWREKISNSLKGRDITWAHKISESTKGLSRFEGKTHTLKTKEIMSKNRKKNYLNLHKQKPVIQYDLNMNFIKEWKSVTEASYVIKGDIAACARGKQKTSGGFIWRFKE